MLERRPAGKQWLKRYLPEAYSGIGVFGGFILAVVALLVVVAIWAAQGRSPVEVPALTGLPQVQAEALLKGVGLSVRATSHEVSAQPAGTVLRTDPAAGVQLDQGAGVSLVLVIAASPAKASGVAEVPAAPPAPPV